MSNSIAYIIITIGVLLCILQFYVGIRNQKVIKFRIHLINLCFERDRRNSYSSHTWNELKTRIASSNKMIFSHKKLTLENWLTPEEIKKLSL